MRIIGLLKIILSTNLGIIILSPDKAAIDVMIIGPKNQARGIFKYSATIALGKEIIKTEINLIVNIWDKFSLKFFINKFIFIYLSDWL